MIKRSETGLTEAQYEIMRTGKDADGNRLSHSFQVVAHRYNPIFTDYGGSGAAASNDTAEFTALAAGVYLYRGTHGGVIERLTTTDVSPAWTTVNSSAPTGERVTPMSLVFNATTETIYCYACTNTGVKSISSTDYGVTWSAWYDEYVTAVISVTPARYSSSLTETPASGAASSVLRGDTAVYGPGRAFDNGLSLPAGAAIWASNAIPTLTAPQWLSYDFGTARSITKYTILGRSSEWFGQNPRNWTLESSPDNTTWTVVDTRVNITKWAADELKTFIIAPLTTDVGSIPVAARYWRINITAHNGDVDCTAIRELDMMMTEFSNSDPGYITAIAAPLWDRIHIVARPYPDFALSQFQTLVRQGDGSWVAVASEIHWTFPIRSFHASSATADRDVIVIASDVPGTLTIQNENNTPQKYLFTSGGVCAFTYQYATWGDHKGIDIVDDVRAWRYRDNARIANLNNQLYVTAYSSDATEEFPVTGHRAYTSGPTARHWSNGDMFPLPAGASTYGVALLAVGEYVYAVQAKKSFRSLSTLYFGYSAASAQVGLTNHINGYEFSQESVFQFGMVLANPLNVFSTHDILNRDNTVYLYHYSGYWVQDGGGYNRLDILVGISQVESLEYNFGNPGMGVKVTSRDTMGRITDYVQSEQAISWKSQSLGGDDFADLTNSNYGGLGHTATEKGAFKTRNNALEINSTDASVAFSTLSSNQWNGSQQIGFLINPNSPAIQEMGVTFRAIDGDNMWSVSYSQPLDKLSLVRRVAGVPLIYNIGSTLGWTALTTRYHYIRVEFYYGRIRVYTGIDSAVDAFDGDQVWTFHSDSYMDCRTRVYGAPYLQRLENCVPESGYVGVIGYGGTVV